MWAQSRIAIVMLVALTVLTGLIYPLVITGIAQIAFPSQANGSLIVKDGKAVGLRSHRAALRRPEVLLGPAVGDEPIPNNAAASSGSNQGPTNPNLPAAVQGRVEALRAADAGNTAPVPVDLVTASGSGLDPHISPAAALYQVSRVARERRLDVDSVRALVQRHIESRTLGVLGELRVNVLQLNLALDGR